MSVPMRDVLVVHPNAGRRAALASALPSHRVVAVESKVEAALRMVNVAPALIIAPPDDARHFLREVDRSAPDAVRVFICSQTDPAGLEELMQSAAEGHVFSILDDTLAGPELGRTISHLLQYRGCASVTLSTPYSVRFGLHGQTYQARCLEMGNFGATLQLPIEVPITAVPPGTALQDVFIEREGQLIFRAAWAHVQRAQPVRELDVVPHLRLGISWSTAMYQPPQAPSMTTAEPSEVVSTLRKALRREIGLWLQMADNHSIQIRLESPSIDVVDDIAILRGQGTSLLPGTVGDVVHLSFEMGGQSYSGVGSLLDISPDGKTMVRIPRSLTLRNWRTLPRFKPGPNHRFLLSFKAPVTGQLTTRAVLDLSAGGLSFPFDASCEILPAGLQFDASLLLPDGSEAECQLEIRSIQMLRTPSPDGQLRPFRAGVRFSRLPEHARRSILDAFVTARCPSAINGGHVPFQELWDLMEAARYRFHPDYPFNSRKDVELLEDAHRKLYIPGELGRSIVFREGERAIGHLAGLRSHSRTWLLQQLCVLPGFHRNQWVSYELSTTLVEFGEALEDIEFIRYTWRRDNRWPNRFGSWLARVMDSPGLSLLRHYNYMRLPLPTERQRPAGLLPVRESTHADRVWLENHLRARGEWVRVLGEDLEADRLELDALGERFHQHGLYRHRRMFVVDGEDGPLALALAEEGTPGLSLIEATNAFWLVVPERSHPQARLAVQSLTERCVEHARERGRPSALGFVDGEDVEVLLEAGFTDLGRFSEWIFHRSLIRRWCELWKSVFERFVRESDVDVMAGVEDP
jgi:hypothetical protein